MCVHQSSSHQWQAIGPLLLLFLFLLLLLLLLLLITITAITIISTVLECIVLCHDHLKNPFIHLRPILMDISELYKCSAGLVSWSHDGRYIATAVEHRLIVRDVDTLQMVQLYTCLDAIQDLQWSPDSKYILCTMLKSGIVQAWSLEKVDWTCKIDEGAVGLSKARWSPDSRHILTSTDFQLRITVWSLVNRSLNFMRFPKYGDRGLAFTRDRQHMALLHRRDCKDSVGIYSCSNWEPIMEFSIETFDAADISWSPDDHVLCVWDTCLEYKILLYSIDGRCLHKYSAYGNALGVKSVSWAPSSQLLAVGSYDERVRVLNNVTWKVLGEYAHPEKIVSQPGVFAFVETSEESDSSTNGISGFGAVKGLTPTKYEVTELPYTVKTVKPDPERCNPKLGVGLMGWSSNSNYLFTRNDNMPTTLWIWETARLSLYSVLVQQSSIRDTAWDPIRPRLAVCTGTSKVYMWSEEGCSCIDIPTDLSAESFKVSSISWNPDGTSLLLADRDRFCVIYIN